MYIVIDPTGNEVFKGGLSDATGFILKHFGGLDRAIGSGVRLIPCEPTNPLRGARS